MKVNRKLKTGWISPNRKIYCRGPQTVRCAPQGGAEEHSGVHCRAQASLHWGQGGSERHPALLCSQLCSGPAFRRCSAPSHGPWPRLHSQPRPHFWPQNCTRVWPCTRPQLRGRTVADRGTGGCNAGKFGDHWFIDITQVLC